MHMDTDFHALELNAHPLLGTTRVPSPAGAVVFTSPAPELLVATAEACKLGMEALYDKLVPIKLATTFGVERLKVVVQGPSRVGVFTLAKREVARHGLIVSLWPEAGTYPSHVKPLLDAIRLRARDAAARSLIVTTSPVVLRECTAEEVYLVTMPKRRVEPHGALYTRVADMAVWHESAPPDVGFFFDRHPARDDFEALSTPRPIVDVSL